MALSRLLHFYKRGLPKSTRLCSSSSSSSKFGRENSMKDYTATERNSQVEDSDLNKEMNSEITKPALLPSVSWNAIKGPLSNLQSLFRSPKCHNKMTAEGTVFVGDKMPSENIMTENYLQKRENNTMTSEAIMNSQNCKEHISTSLKSNITEGNSSPDMETNSGDTVSMLMENKVERKQFTEDNFSDTLENMVASDISKRNIDSNTSVFSKNGSVFQSSKAIVDSETKKKYSPESVTSYIARKRSSEETRQSELNHAGDRNQVVELMSDILGALKSETRYVSRSTSQLPHNASKGLQKDATNGLTSIGQGNHRNDKKTKNSQKLGDSFGFSEISGQCDRFSKDEDMANLIVNSARDQTEKVPNKPNKKEEDLLSRTALNTIGDVRKARSNLEVVAEDCIKLKSNSQIHLSTGQGNVSEDTSKCFIQEGSTENKALVRFLHKNVEDKMLFTVFKHCGVIKKIQLLSSIEGSYFKDAYVYFETREALEKALLKKDLMIGRGDAFLEPSLNQISIPNLIDDIDIPAKQVKNPTRTVLIKQLTSDIKLHQLKDALGLCKSGISSFFRDSSSSVGYLEFESENAKERAVATHTIHVRGKQLALYRIDVPRTTIVRISNFNDLADSKIMSVCKSLGKVKKLSFRGETIVDVHFKLAEWPKMLSIVNSLNGMEVEGKKLVAQPAPYFPPEILKVLWSHPEERNHVISVVRRLLQNIEDPLQSKRVGMLAANLIHATDGNLFEDTYC